MQTEIVQQQIRELEAIKRQTRLLRLGATIGSFVIVLGCVGIMSNAVRNLFQPGPTQQQFVQQVSGRMQRDVVPQVQRLAVQTVTDSRPIVEKEFVKLNSQVPRVAQASVTEFNTLQKELPERTEKALDDTFGEMIKGREAKLKQMFPDATDDKINALLNNLTDEGTTQLSDINHKLFDPHINSMMAISANLDKIHQQEAPAIKGEVPTWQMGLLLFDIARSDFKGYEMPGLDGAPSGGKTTVTTGAKKPAKAVAKPAAAVSQATPKGY